MIRGKHNKPGKTREIIIRYILDHLGETEEPLLREYLYKKHDISDQKTIKKHLEQLREMGYIKKHKKTGLSNRWKIDGMEGVCKIFEKFPELRQDLQKNDSVIEMLLHEHHQILKEPKTQIYFKSFIEDSPKFLEMFLKYSSEELSKIVVRLPEIDYSKCPIADAELIDKLILKIFCASKISDILLDRIEK
jgi:Fe2+ or Zn2+ uptake regulation protein